MVRTLCYIATYIAEAFIAYHYFNTLFEKKRKTWQITLSLGCSYILLFFLSNIDNFILNAVAFTLINGLIVLTCFDCHIKGAAFHAIILVLLSTGAELIILAIIGNIFGDFEIFRKRGYILFLLGAASKLLYFFLIELCLFFLGSQKKRQRNHGSTALLLGFSPFASTIVMLMLIYIGFETEGTPHIRLLSIAVTLLLICSNVMVFIAYDHYQKLNDHYLESQLELSRQKSDEEYYQILERQYEEQRILIHDIRSHLATIRALLLDQESSAAQQYLTEVEASPALSEKVRWCANPTLNVLLRYYAAACKQSRVEFIIDIRHESMDFMDPMDINALFRNLLQNALEAAETSAERTIDLAIRVAESSGNIVISLCNSCDRPPIPLSAELFQSRKENPSQHGLGMKSIQRVIKKYDGKQSMDYDAEQKVFSHRILFFQK